MNNGVLTRGSGIIADIATTLWDYWPIWGPQLKIILDQKFPDKFWRYVVWGLAAWLVTYVTYIHQEREKNSFTTTHLPTPDILVLKSPSHPIPISGQCTAFVINNRKNEGGGKGQQPCFETRQGVPADLQ